MAEAVSWSRRALADLEEIVAYVSTDSPAAAARLKAQLQAAGESLAAFPQRGRSLRGPLRQLVSVRPYLITYQADVSPLRILTVRHEARRPL